MKTPFPPQQRLIDLGVSSLKKHKVFLDSSVTGAGKTLMAVERCRALDMPGFVVCPLAVVPSWRKAFEEQGVPCAGIVGWEKLRTGKTGFGRWVTKHQFDWSLSDCVVIFDEVQKAKGRSSQNSKMLIGAKASQLPVLLCSATSAKDPSEMYAIGYALGLHQCKNFVTWAQNHGCEFDFWGSLQMTTSETLARHHLGKLNDAIYGSGKGGRLTREDLVGHFQECAINDDPVDFGSELKSAYNEMADEISIIDGEIKADMVKARAKARQKGEDPANAEVNALTRLLRMRQKVEALKVPVIIDTLKEFRDEGFSVAVFVNFDATADAILARLEEPFSVVRGGQKEQERAFAIENFQRNAHRVIVCNISAGGTGVNLHDEDGGHPRASIISPSFNEKELEQVLGRIDRAGSKTPSLQRILIAADTIEERVMESVRAKLRNMNVLHDTEKLRNKLLTDFVPSHTLNTQLGLPMPQVLEFTEENPTGVMVEVPEPVAKTRYFIHPESNSLFTTDDGSFPSDGLVEELDKEQYDKELAAKTKALSPAPPVAEPAHAEFGPSTLKYFEIAPMYRPRHDDTNEAAEKGTRIHLACETGNLEALVDEERLIAEQMLAAVDMIRARHKLPPDVEDHKEIRLYMRTPSGIETFGTCDRLFIHMNEGVMIDYKTGRNAIDDPEINAQTQAYVAGAFQKFPQLQTVHFYFIVPVRDEVLFATYTRAQLPDLLLRITAIIARAKVATTCNPQPGICDFCARLHDATCLHIERKALVLRNKYLEEGFPIPEEVHSSKVTDGKTMGELLRLSRLMKDWSEAVAFRAKQMAFEEGQEIDGFTKMRVGGKTAVLSTLGAFNALKDQMTPEEFMSCCTLDMGKAESYFSDKAGKGKKAAAIEAMKDTLQDAGLLVQGEGSYQLRVKRK